MRQIGGGAERSGRTNGITAGLGLGLLGTLLLFLAPGSLRAEPPASPPELLENATLRDVLFLDPDRGFAIGDRGIILATEDGGRHWKLQDSPVTARLNSLCFVDPQQGWIVGGWVHPYTGKSIGVVLQTSDGGRRWVRRAGDTLPDLRGVRFFNERQGAAFGDASSLFPTGILLTQDGGASWTPLPGERGSGWQAGGFLDPHTGVLVSPGSQAALLLHPKLLHFGLSEATRPGVTAVQLQAAGTSWMVGRHGWLRQSTNGGRAWHAPATPVPLDDCPDWEARDVAVWQDACWIVGNPGMHVLHGQGGGSAWERLATNQQAPLEAVHFLDAHRGWAVGALGTILSTRDGGRSWSRQRGHDRVAVLGLFADPGQVPWELFARLCASEGYVAAVEIVSPPRPSPDEAATAEARLQEAALRAGIAYCSFRPFGPAREAEGAVPRLPPALQQACLHRLRQWRPEILVTSATGAADPGAEVFSRQLVELLSVAVGQAAEGPKRPAGVGASLAPEREGAGGSPQASPWRVRKLIARTADSSQGGLNVPTSQLSPRLGRTFGEQVFAARCLVEEPPRSIPEVLSFALLASDLPSDLAGKDFFSGLHIPPEDPIRRNHGPLTGNLEELTRRHQQYRLLRQLLDRPWSDADGNVLLGELMEHTRDLPPQAASDTLLAWSEHYRSLGKWNSSLEIWRLMLERYPREEATHAAACALLQYYVSSECAAWRRPPRPAEVQAATALLPLSRDPTDQERPAVPRGEGLAGESHPRLARHAAAEALLKQFGERWPTLAMEPEIRMAAAALARQQRQWREASQVCSGVATDRYPEAWRDCARAELWLAHRRGAPPRPLSRCSLAAERPRLDGHLDDPLWQHAEALGLAAPGHSGSGAGATRLQFGFDDEFLYLAVEAQKVATSRYPGSAAPRPRDPDLRREDRIELYLDLDRDGGTYFSLTLDHRGWVREACLGDSHWDPTWYVAQAADERTWRVEAALPWSAISLEPPGGMTIAVGAKRVVPGVGESCWPAQARIPSAPETFGLLQLDGFRAGEIGEP